MRIITSLSHRKINRTRIKLPFQPPNPRNCPPLNKSTSLFHTKRSLQGGKRGGTSRIYKGSIPHSSLTALSKALNPLFSGSPSHQSALCSTMTDRQLSLPRESNFS